MGFTHLSGNGGAQLALASKQSLELTAQLDAVAVDDETALAIECKSCAAPKKDPLLKNKLAVHASYKKRFAQAIANLFPEGKRHVATVMMLWDLIPTDNDRARAEEEGVVLFDERDLAYFEALVSHLGPAAKFQLLADVFPGKKIAGLEVRVPALRSKMGGHTCYTFSIEPEYLLKIAFVSHRAKGHATDIDAYQRMISKSRLKKIREFISADGIFPTNIVLNLKRARYVRFEHGSKKGTSRGARFGTLTLSPSYKSAWIIDGQHRLFAYSGHERASTSHLSVLAFEGLPPSEQAGLFVNINSEQKRVRRSLLDELWAELHWQADDPEMRVRAVISKAVQALNEDQDSPLYGRILLSDAKKTAVRCITLSSVLSAIAKSGFYIRKGKRNTTGYGPLWGSTNSKMLRRTIAVIKTWLSGVITGAKEWWDLGSDPGGGLAMNDGVTACINVLRSVLDHLESDNDLTDLADSELCEIIGPYAMSLGSYLGSLTVSKRDEFRKFRGVQGQTASTRMCQQAMQSRFPKFDPAGLSDWVERQKSGTNEKGREIIERIVSQLQTTILSALKEHFRDSGENAWWWKGIPPPVRKKIDERINESAGELGSREQNFDLIHYREVIRYRWDLFGKTFGYTQDGQSKDKQTQWIVKVNAMRSIVSHVTRQQFLSNDDLVQLQDYAEWLDAQLSSARNSAG